MENNKNIAELLKDCPSGMELDCTMFNNVTLVRVSENENNTFPIAIITKSGHRSDLTKYGQYSHNEDAKCVIFPKGEDNWEGFVPPIMFKDGDIVTTDTGIWIGITTGGKRNISIPTYCVIKEDGTFEAYIDKKEKWIFDRLATEEEKERLFSVIKAHGYQWNKDTKTLEKLSKPKFDINTLVPFESKVLVRDYDDETWKPAIWGMCNDNDGNYYKYIVIGGVGYRQLIPYDNNEHLKGKSKDCSEYYKTW